MTASDWRVFDEKGDVVLALAFPRKRKGVIRVATAGFKDADRATWDELVGHPVAGRHDVERRPVHGLDGQERDTVEGPLATTIPCEWCGAETSVGGGYCLRCGTALT